MDWIYEHEEFFLGMAVGSWVVLTFWSFAESLLRRDVKKLERYAHTHIKRTNREHDHE